MKKLIKNIKAIITMSDGDIPRRGKDLNKIGKVINKDIIIENNYIYSIENKGKYSNSEVDMVIDAENSFVLPGLIDCHTHPVFGGSRENEFYLRAQGKSYLEILKSGGGILSTVNMTRELNNKDLELIAKKHLYRFIENGTTTVEAKSGYGLNLETEIRMLKILNKKIYICDIIPTFLGAHTFPVEYKNNHQHYIDIVCNSMIPEISDKKLATNIDIFCDKGAFNIQQAEQILNSAIKHNFKIRMHAEQLSHSNSIELALKYKAKSVDHIVKASKNDINLLKDSNTTSVLLPGTEIFLNQDEFAPARDLIDSGAIVALATDFNPGSCTIQNLFLIGSFAVSKLKMSFPEILNSITVNPAFSLDIHKSKGIIKPGYLADLILIDLKNIEEIFYWMGYNPINLVLKSGSIVYKRNSIE